MPEPDALVELVLTRLERISVDSPLAHKASGVRGSLLRALERQAKGLPTDPEELQRSVTLGLAILNRAAASRSGRRFPR